MLASHVECPLEQSLFIGLLGVASPKTASVVKLKPVKPKKKKKLASPDF